MESKAWRDHFGSVRGGPVRRQRRDKEETRKTRGQEDRRKGKKGGGRGELRGGGASPAGALAHLPCYHTKGDTIRVGLKDGGKRENAPLSFFFSPPLARKDGPGRRQIVINLVL